MHSHAAIELKLSFPRLFFLARKKRASFLLHKQEKYARSLFQREKSASLFFSQRAPIKRPPRKFSIKLHKQRNSGKNQRTNRIHKPGHLALNRHVTKNTDKNRDKEKDGNRPQACMRVGNEFHLTSENKLMGCAKTRTMMYEETLMPFFPCSSGEERRNRICGRWLRGLRFWRCISYKL